jgi:hypothetical protein
MTWMRRVMVALAASLLLAAQAEARPTYFNAFTSYYSIGGSDNLNACGVCHFRWFGTGARNAFGNEVEQQLYLGKTITQALQDIESFDSDSDGFTNGDEIMTYMTLPGYSCSTFHLAIDAPSDYHTYITPMIASCLEPHDIRTAPTSVSMLVEVGDVGSVHVEIFNNGTDFPLNVSAYGLSPGSHAAFSVVGPTPPFSIPVGDSVMVEVQFAPMGPAFAGGALRIDSDDPDEDPLDVPLTAFGFITPLAPADARAGCLRDIDKYFRGYTKTHFREWSRCYLDEVKGVACDAARRDLQVDKSAAKLRERIGGEKDRRCQSAGVTPVLLGYPDNCGGGCGDIEVTTYDSYLDCLTCRQDEARDAMLAAALGTAPPDLPPNVISGQSATCQKTLLKAVEKAIAKSQKLLGRCELDNVTAASPVDCPAALAEDLAAIRAKVDNAILQCGDTTGMLGCLFEPAPGCLGDASAEISQDLVDSAFGLED